MTRDTERRYLAQPVEIRAAQSGLGTLYGYAAKFNTLSQNLGGFVETIATGAFTKTIADSGRVLCRYNHDDAALLGTTDAGTLRVATDDIGLAYEDDLPDTTSGRDVGVLASRGDVRFSSFAFRCIEDEWGVTEQGFPLRTLLAVQLVDVAPVNSPAYLDTSTAKRSLETYMTEKRDLPADVDAKLRALLSTLAVADKGIDPIADAIRVADLALDAGQATISAILGVPNPDDDPDLDGDVEADSLPATGEQRATHSPVEIQRRLLDLEWNR